MTDKNYDDHPCFECARNGEGGAIYDFPHPAVKCVVDNHRSLDILGDLKTCLDGLYKKCPKNKEDQKLTDDQLFGETDFEEENQRLRRENECLLSKNRLLTAFIVERGLATDYWKWKVMFDE